MNSVSPSEYCRRDAIANIPVTARFFRAANSLMLSRLPQKNNSQSQVIFLTDPSGIRAHALSWAK